MSFSLTKQAYRKRRSNHGRQVEVRVSSDRHRRYVDGPATGTQEEEIHPGFLGHPPPIVDPQSAVEDVLKDPPHWYEQDLTCYLVEELLQVEQARITRQGFWNNYCNRYYHALRFCVCIYELLKNKKILNYSLPQEYKNADHGLEQHVLLEKFKIVFNKQLINRTVDKIK